MATTQVIFARLPTRATVELPTSPGPRADIVRTSDAVHVVVEVPGVAPGDLRLRFEPERLIVEGERSQQPWGEAARVLQMEIGYGAWQRVLALPIEADGENITATHENGILRVRVPLKPRLQHAPRQISVS